MRIETDSARIQHVANIVIIPRACVRSTVVCVHVSILRDFSCLLSFFFCPSITVEPMSVGSGTRSRHGSFLRSPEM